MKNAIILHGGPSKEEYYDPKLPSESNSHWLPWLQAQLIKNEIKADTPEVPHSFERVWDVWNKEIERFEIGPETILIGHSTGAGFFVKYLSTHKNLRVDQVILVAPWLDPDHQLTTPFFTDFEIDPNLVSRTKRIIIFNSDNDQESVQKTVRLLREKITNIEYREFHNYGHFCYEDMKTTKFLELLETVLEK